jgi:hypothetical protein
MQAAPGVISGSRGLIPTTCIGWVDVLDADSATFARGVVSIGAYSAYSSCLIEQNLQADIEAISGEYRRRIGRR